MKAIKAALVATLLSICLRPSAHAGSEVQIETQRFIRTLERHFHAEGRGYFKDETDLSKWIMNTHDVANAAREARWNAGMPVAPLKKVEAMIERHCQFLSPACVAAVVVFTSSAR